MGFIYIPKMDLTKPTNPYILSFLFRGTSFIHYQPLKQLAIMLIKPSNQTIFLIQKSPKVGNYLLGRGQIEYN